MPSFLFECWRSKIRSSDLLRKSCCHHLQRDDPRDTSRVVCWVGTEEDVPAVQVSGTITVKSVAMAKAERREGLHTNRTAGLPVHQYIKKTSLALGVGWQTKMHHCCIKEWEQELPFGVLWSGTSSLSSASPCVFHCGYWPLGNMSVLCGWSVCPCYFSVVSELSVCCVIPNNGLCSIFVEQHIKHSMGKKWGIIYTNLWVLQGRKLLYWLRTALDHRQLCAHVAFSLLAALGSDCHSTHAVLFFWVGHGREHNLRVRLCTQLKL